MWANSIVLKDGEKVIHDISSKNNNIKNNYLDKSYLNKKEYENILRQIKVNE